MHLTNDDGDTALHCPAFAGHASIIPMLIVAGANVNAQHPLGKTAQEKMVIIQFTQI